MPVATSERKLRSTDRGGSRESCHEVTDEVLERKRRERRFRSLIVETKGAFFRREQAPALLCTEKFCVVDYRLSACFDKSEVSVPILTMHNSKRRKCPDYSNRNCVKFPRISFRIFALLYRNWGFSGRALIQCGLHLLHQIKNP